MPSWPPTSSPPYADRVRPLITPTIDRRHRRIARPCCAAEHPGRLRVLALRRGRLGGGAARPTVLPGGVRERDETDLVPRAILLRGGYELAALARFDALIGGAAGARACRAHRGLYPLRRARALAPCCGLVCAVEPSRAHAGALLRNAAPSGLTQIERCSAAVASAPAPLRMLAPHAAHPGGRRLAIGPVALDQDLRTIPLHVPARPAAEFVPPIPPPGFDLVQIDVEGHTFPILRSRLAAAPRLPRDLLFVYEPAEFDDRAPTETTEWLRSLGYDQRTSDGAPPPRFRAPSAQRQPLGPPPTPIATASSPGIANASDTLRCLLAVAVVGSYAFFLGGCPPAHVRAWTEGQAFAGELAVLGCFGLSGYLVTASCTRSHGFFACLAKRVRRIGPGLSGCLVVTASVMTHGREWRLATLPCKSPREARAIVNPPLFQPPS